MIRGTLVDGPTRPVAGFSDDRERQSMQVPIELKNPEAGSRRLGHDRVRMLQLGAGQELRVPGDVGENQVALDNPLDHVVHRRLTR